MVAGVIEYGSFDFGLSAEQEDRARRLHASSIICDLHYQGPCSPDVWTEELVSELDPERVARSDGWDYVWGYLNQKALRGEFPQYRELFELSGATAALASSRLSDERRLLDAAYEASRTLTAFPWARRARSAADFRAAKEANEVVFWGMCWDNLMRPGDLHLIDIGKELGVMDVVELAYNRMNFVGAGCTERYDPGLSNFGLDFVRRCNEVGVIVDTSHSGRQTTLDACRASTNPVIATHTAAEELYRHDRCKSDEELRALAQSGGVIGIIAVPFYVGPTGQGQTIELVLDHIDYVVELVGFEHVAIGTDWPLAMPPSLQDQLMRPVFEALGFRDEHAIDCGTTLTGFRDPRDLVNITRGLVARGYSDDKIRAILGENFIRVFEDVCG